MKLILLAVLLGNMQVTSYRSVPEQTDDTPFITSIGEKVCKDGVAASQDLLANGTVHYGDWLYIEGIGLKRVNDTMHERHKQAVDIWVATYAEEKAIGIRHNNVWLVKPSFAKEISLPRKVSKKYYLKNANIKKTTPSQKLGIKN